MSESTLSPDERAQEIDYGRRPGWLSSLVLHAILLVVLAVTIQAVPPGAVDEPDRTTGIVLKSHKKPGEYYDGNKDDIEAASQSLNGQADTT
ncbi:MAG: hypothetical protein N2C12_06765, partial [Planctomycetales bacterium]